MQEVPETWIPSLDGENPLEEGMATHSSILAWRILRIARRDKKVFFSDQCKEIEENNRMGKTRDLFKKIRDTKGTFHVKMGTIKDINCMDPQKQKILRGGKNTKTYYA